MNKPLPKYSRKPKQVSFQITDRDVDILKTLNRYRYMRTGQIHRLLFSDNTTQQSARRRLRNLYHHRYIARAQPYVQVGKPMPEIAYYLDRKGRQVLKEHDETVRYWRKGREVKYQFLEHAIALSEFRLKLEQAVDLVEGLTLDRFVPDFEMRDAAEHFVGKKRYMLYREITHPANRKTYIVHPDAMIILSVQKDGKSASRLIFVEIDQGTQGLERIRDKVTGYWLYKEQGLMKQFGQFNNFLLLFQTPTERRAGTMFDALLGHQGSEFTRISHVESLSKESLLTEPVWKDMQGEMKRIIRSLKD